MDGIDTSEGIIIALTVLAGGIAAAFTVASFLRGITLCGRVTVEDERRVTEPRTRDGPATQPAEEDRDRTREAAAPTPRPRSASPGAVNIPRSTSLERSYQDYARHSPQGHTADTDFKAVSPRDRSPSPPPATPTATASANTPKTLTAVVDEAPAAQVEAATIQLGTQLYTGPPKYVLNLTSVLAGLFVAALLAAILVAPQRRASTLTPPPCELRNSSCVSCTAFPDSPCQWVISSNGSYCAAAGVNTTVNNPFTHSCVPSEGGCSVGVRIVQANAVNRIGPNVVALLAFVMAVSFGAVYMRTKQPSAIWVVMNLLFLLIGILASAAPLALNQVANYPRPEASCVTCLTESSWVRDGVQASFCVASGSCYNSLEANATCASMPITAAFNCPAEDFNFATRVEIGFFVGVIAAFLLFIFVGIKAFHRVHGGGGQHRTAAADDVSGTGLYYGWQDHLGAERALAAYYGHLRDFYGRVYCGCIATSTNLMKTIEFIMIVREFVQFITFVNAPFNPPAINGQSVVNILRYISLQFALVEGGVVAMFIAVTIINVLLLARVGWRFLRATSRMARWESFDSIPVTLLQLLFIPVIEANLVIWSCNYDHVPYPYVLRAPAINCWLAPHWIATVFAIANIIVFMIIVVTGSVCKELATYGNVTYRTEYESFRLVAQATTIAIGLLFSAETKLIYWATAAYAAVMMIFSLLHPPVLILTPKINHALAGMYACLLTVVLAGSLYGFDNFYVFLVVLAIGLVIALIIGVLSGQLNRCNLATTNFKRCMTNTSHGKSRKQCVEHIDFDDIDRATIKVILRALAESVKPELSVQKGTIGRERGSALCEMPQDLQAFFFHTLCTIKFPVMVHNYLSMDVYESLLISWWMEFVQLACYYINHLPSQADRETKWQELYLAYIPDGDDDYEDGGAHPDEHGPVNLDLALEKILIFSPIFGPMKRREIRCADVDTYGHALARLAIKFNHGPPPLKAREQGHAKHMPTLPSWPFTPRPSPSSSSVSLPAQAQPPQPTPTATVVTRPPRLPRDDDTSEDDGEALTAKHAPVAPPLRPAPAPIRSGGPSPARGSGHNSFDSQEEERDGKAVELHTVSEGESSTEEQKSVTPRRGTAPLQVQTETRARALSMTSDPDATPKASMTTTPQANATPKATEGEQPSADSPSGGFPPEHQDTPPATPEPAAAAAAATPARDVAAVAAKLGPGTGGSRRRRSTNRSLDESSSTGFFESSSEDDPAMVPTNRNAPVYTKAETPLTPAPAAVIVDITPTTTTTTAAAPPEMDASPQSSPRTPKATAASTGALQHVRAEAVDEAGFSATPLGDTDRKLAPDSESDSDSDPDRDEGNKAPQLPPVDPLADPFTPTKQEATPPPVTATEPVKPQSPADKVPPAKPRKPIPQAWAEARQSSRENVFVSPEKPVTAAAPASAPAAAPEPAVVATPAATSATPTVAAANAALPDTTEAPAAGKRQPGKLRNNILESTGFNPLVGSKQPVKLTRANTYENDTPPTTAAAAASVEPVVQPPPKPAPPVVRSPAVSAAAAPEVDDADNDVAATTAPTEPGQLLVSPQRSRPSVGGNRRRPTRPTRG